MNKNANTRRAAVPLLGLLPLALTAASAQDSAGRSAGLQAIEEIVVTARKREERLQDVPLTISVLTDERLLAAGIRDIQSLANFTPGFHFENVGNRQSTQPRFRGMDINTAIPTRQNASFFIDGVYMPGSVQGLDFSQFERIEVIKGPQSALFGRQTFGGAVNFVSKAPSDELTGQLIATAGSNSLREISGNVSFPLIAERLFLRGSAAYSDRDGPFVDSVDGTRLGARESQSASLAMTWVPVDGASITLRYVRQEDDDGPDAILQVGANQLNCGPFGGTFRFYCGPLPTSGLFAGNYNVAPNSFGITEFGYTRDADLFSAVAEWQLADHTFSITGARFKEESLSVGDADVSSVPRFSSVTPREFTDTSVDIRVVSAADQRLRYIAGVFGYNGELLNRFFTTIPANLSALPATWTFDEFSARNRSVYGSLTYDITDTFTLSGELRFQDDEVIDIAGEGANRRTLRGSTKKWLPRLIADWKLSDDLLAYAIFARGNKPKQFNANIAARTPTEQEYIRQTFGVETELAEETLNNYELGLKSTWRDGSVVSNVALFQMDWGNQITRRQVFPSPTSTAQINAVANAGSTRIRGLELETFVRLTEVLSVDATYAYTDAEYTSFNSINTEQVFGDPETRGRKAPRFPKHQGSLSIILSHALAGGWGGTFRFDNIYKGKRFTDEVNLAYAPSYWTSNLRATADNGSLSFTLYFENVFDEEYVLSGSRFRDLSQVPFTNQFSFPYSISEGRKVGVTARYRF